MKAVWKTLRRVRKLNSPVTVKIDSTLFQVIEQKSVLLMQTFFIYLN